MELKNDIKNKIYSNKKFISKQLPKSIFQPPREGDLDRMIENYLYHAFNSKIFNVSDDENNHSLKFKDKITILQSFIDLKIMGISKNYFEFAVYQTAIEGSPNLELKKLPKIKPPLGKLKVLENVFSIIECKIIRPVSQ